MFLWVGGTPILVPGHGIHVDLGLQVWVPGHGVHVGWGYSNFDAMAWCSCPPELVFTPLLLRIEVGVNACNVPHVLVAELTNCMLLVKAFLLHQILCCGLHSSWS